MEYSDSDGNRTDVLVTMIDCAVEQENCAIFKVGGTPQMQLVIGPRRRYWPRIGSRDGKDWNVFIDLYVKPSLREITTDEELENAKQEPWDGGTTFHAEVPSNTSDLRKELSQFSKEFRIYNDTFTYRVNSSLTSPVITAWTSPHCAVVYETGPLRAFIDAWKFGCRHRYDKEEYQIMNHRSASLIMMVEEHLAHAQNFALSQLPKGYCDKVEFGWSSAKESKSMLKEVNKTLGLPVWETSPL
jgi:hypothetical protein